MPMVTHPNISMVKIRQVYARHGHSYCIVSLPVRLMEAFGWRPGQFLAAYPTKDKAVKLMHQEQLMPKDFDPGFAAGAEPMKPPKPGSIHEREIEIDREMEEMEKRLGAIARSRKEDQAPTKPQAEKGRRRGLGWLGLEARRQDPRSRRSGSRHGSGPGRRRR